MKIEEISESNGKGNGGRKELGGAEKWLFDIENGEIRLKTLKDMEHGKQATIELKEFEPYGSKATTSNGLAISLNRVFILAKLPLIARGRKEAVVIIKTQKYNVNDYSKADKRPFGSNHIETLKSKLAELK